MLRLPVLVGPILIPRHGRIRSVKVNPDSQHRYWQYLAYVYFSFPSEFMIWHLHDVRWGSALGSSASRWKRILSGQFCIIMMAQSFALSSPSRRYIAYPNCSVHMNYTVKALLHNETLSAVVLIATLSAPANQPSDKHVNPLLPVTWWHFVMHGVCYDKVLRT
jgi:hypothetical protein